MRLLLITQDFPPVHGGIQTYMGEIAPFLAQECEFFKVIAPVEEDCVEFDQTLPFPVQRMAIHSSFLVAGIWFKLRSLIQKDQITHILFAQWFPALALPKNLSVQVGIIAHGREYLNHPLGRFGLKLLPWALRQADWIFPNSKRTAQLIPTDFQSKVQVVYPGVNLQKFSPASLTQINDLRKSFGIQEDEIVLTVLTRLVPRKGVDTLIQTFQKLAVNFPNLKLVIGGSGPDKERLQELAQKSFSERILFAGRIADASLNAFYGMGIFCLLSREEQKDIEGFGLVLAEAQACGAVVICARSGGMPEAVLEGKSALIVQTDDIENAAKGIAELLKEKDKLSQMRIEALAFAQNLSWERCSQEIMQCLRGGRE